MACKGSHTHCWCTGGYVKLAQITPHHSGYSPHYPVWPFFTPLHTTRLINPALCVYVTSLNHCRVGSHCGEVPGIIQCMQPHNLSVMLHLLTSLAVTTVPWGITSCVPLMLVHAPVHRAFVQLRKLSKPACLDIFLEITNTIKVG